MMEATVTIWRFAVPTMWLFSAASVAVTTVVFWYLRHKRGETQGNNEDTFDVVVFGMLGGILLARIVGFLGALDHYADAGWSINPLQDQTGDFAPFDALPWAFVKIWDGNFNYQLVGVGSLIGAWLLSSSKRRIKDLRVVLDKYVVAGIIGQAVLIIGSMLTASYVGKEYSGLLTLEYGGAKRFPLQLFEIISLLVTFVVINSESVRTRKGRKVAVYLLIGGISQFILGFFLPGEELDTVVFGTAQLAGIGMVILSLVFFGEGKRKGDGQNLSEVPIKRVENAELAQGKEKPGYSVSYGAGRRWKGEQKEGVLKRIFKKKAS